MKKVLVTGYFKTIHSGHVRLLKFASNLGGKLIVGVNVNYESDVEHRWQSDALMSFGIIDEIVFFDGDVPELLESVKPDVVVKGLEFATKSNIEEEYLLRTGGKLIFSSGQSMIEDDFPDKDLDASPLNFRKLNSNSLLKLLADADRLQEIVESFRKVKVCVIGDVIVDEYINCRILGLSQEEPLPVASPIDSKRFIGGAAIVAAHQSTLGAETTLLTVMGDDSEANWIADEMKAAGVNLKYVKDNARPTTLKQRYRRGQQTLFKLSRLSEQSIVNETREEFLELVKRNISEVDLVVFSDFSYGIIDEELVKLVVEYCTQNGVLVCGDSQSSSQIGLLSRFFKISLLTPTEYEARQELRNPNDGLAVIAEELRRKLEVGNLILKLGADGILVQYWNSAKEDIATEQIPALNHHPIDTSGAGDSLLAISALSLAIEDNILNAAFLGSIGAGLQISRVGNTPLTKLELLKELNNYRKIRN